MKKYQRFLRPIVVSAIAVLILFAAVGYGQGGRAASPSVAKSASASAAKAAGEIWRQVEIIRTGHGVPLISADEAFTSK